jgi:uncharacterized Zn-binding protein involved in type VI secretion
MSIPVATLNMNVVGICCAHAQPTCIPTSGIIGGGAATVTAEGMPVARLGDNVILACGHSALIAGGSASVLAENLPVARLGDSVTGVFTGNIAGGAPTTQAG